MSIYNDNIWLITMERLFASCGFDDKQSKILTFLSAHNYSTAGIISKNLSIKRPTVYAILDKMVNDGLVKNIKSRGVSHYSIENPEYLPKKIILKAKNDFERTISSAESLTRELKTVALSKKTNNLSGFKIKAVDTLSGVIKEVEHALMSEGFSAIFNPKLTLTGDGLKISKKFLNITSVTKPKIRELVVPSSAAERYKTMVKNPNHQVRDLPKGFLVETDIIIYSNSVCLTHYYDKAWSAITVEQKELSTTFNSIFEMLWLATGRRGI